MPRVPKSVAQHKLDGTYRKDRHGKRLNLPSDKPDLPSDLSAGEAELWQHIVENIPVAKVDALALRCLVESWRLYRRSYDAFIADPDKETRITWKACQDAFIAIARQFGMTPVSRSQIKLAEPPADKDDPFTAIMSKRPAGPFLTGMGRWRVCFVLKPMRSLCDSFHQPPKDRFLAGSS